MNKAYVLTLFLIINLLYLGAFPYTVYATNENFNSQEQMSSVYSIANNDETTENQQALSSEDINKEIHNYYKNEQEKVKSHYTPLSVLITLVIVIALIIWVIKWQNKNM